MLSDSLVLYGSARGASVKILKAIEIQRKQKLPKTFKFKPDGSDEFWQNLLHSAFKRIQG